MKAYRVKNIPLYLSGKVRYRIDLFGSIVLQVEVIVTVIRREDAWMPGKDAHSIFFKYKDATMADTVKLKNMGKGPSNYLRQCLVNKQQQKEVLLAKAFLTNKVIVLIYDIKNSWMDMAESMRRARRNDFKPELFK